MKVAIVGYAVNNRGAYEYWTQKGDDVTIVDEKLELENVPQGAKTILGPDAFSNLTDFDLVIKTPPIRPDRISTNGKLWSVTNEFFKACPAPIIGVTGTKGKGTTCSLITEILKAAQKTVHLVGNIGIPALEVLPRIKKEDIVVFELSSFQLWDLQQSPHTAVVLMIEPDHMDVHASMEEYVAAKSNIVVHQSSKDIVVYHPTNDYSGKIARSSNAETKKRYFTSEGAYVDNEQIKIDGTVICDVKEVNLLGKHNLENVCAAITAVWTYTNDSHAIKKAVSSFSGLPHHLELVRELNQVKYYDDSYSAAPAATVAAISSFEAPEVLLCGGYDRNLDLLPLAHAISARKNIKKVIVFGQTKDRIAKELESTGFKQVEVVQDSNFAEIIRRAHAAASPGDVVILSPGSPSFDMFKNFTERGEMFKEIVGELV